MTEAVHTARAPSQDGLPAPRRYWAAATLLCGISLTVLDTTIVNVALPTIAANLGEPASSMVWVVNSYSLTIVMFLLLMAALAERLGFKRLFTFGVVAFMLSSLGCALSTTLWQLNLARVCQGVGAATLMCMFGGMVRNIYPSRHLGRGVSLNATVVALMSVLGPSIGSLIVSVASWRWIFAVNVPVSLVLLMGIRTLPDVPRIKGPIDVPSALLSMAAMAAFIIGVDDLTANFPKALLLIAAAVALTMVLVRRANGQQAPLVPIDLLRIRPLGYAVAASVCTFAAQTAAYVSLPFYFLHELGRAQWQLGMLMAAWPIGTAAIAVLAGRLADRYSAALLSGLGAGAMAIALVGVALLPHGASNKTVMGVMFLAGLGFGFFQTPNNRAMLGAAPIERSGAAGGVQSATRVFGQSLGTALVAVAYGLNLAHGSTMALILAAACAVLAVGVNTVRSARLSIL
ncbi:MFS transporter [Bordetella sp. FB-8]|uniref:MFS transporter n=1 Tax=Bordetella sp. FB-8 TaxID=1159870 RepID=UPI00036EEE97|nr:MFS transporter [Bordetella sp. FB-8]